MNTKCFARICREYDELDKQYDTTSDVINANELSAKMRAKMLTINGEVDTVMRNVDVLGCDVDDDSIAIMAYYNAWLVRGSHRR
jgi:hypothetical protein